LPIAIDNSATRCVVRLEGDIDVTCSTELKRTLIEAISSGKEVQIDLAQAGDLDVTAIQLLWAAKREAEKAALPFVVSAEVPENIHRAVCEAGFKNFPGAVIPKSAAANPGPSPTGTLDD
jgi:anti-anti-sigma regulatory factor